MASTVPVATAQLIGTFVETFSYGIYIAIFPRCMAIFWNRYKGRQGQIGSSVAIYFILTMVLLLLVITLHVVTNLTRAFQAFTANITVGGAAEVYFKNGNTSLNMCKVASNVTVTLIGDLVMLYRTSIIWRQTWWILILPTCLFFFNIAMSAWHTWSVGEAQPGSSILNSATYERSLYFFAATLAFNFVCTILVIVKLWRTRRGFKFVAVNRPRWRYYGVSSHQVTKMFAIILESAAIYSAALVCLIGTALVHHSAYFILYNSMPPLVGSVFSFVILRSTVQDDNDPVTGTQTSSFTSANVNGGAWALRPISSPLQVHITHDVIKRMPENDSWDAELGDESPVERVRENMVRTLRCTGDD
ncbi:hypothetical protein E1B28_011834 [Marasmius oreades]|uniref:Uncharacterized protein n=1 Tax=Marasmius oreades TaxID=181124 RepID=A0A9P7RUW9_9AGAR|nr:uncharacterized protein E1B28_011834 [Marasmius oreades]KAG7090234.1 hypothetical protein E1B28_011834 [Marasmius oreades]